MNGPEVINLAHGGGGSRMLELLTGTVFPILDDPLLFDRRTRPPWTCRRARGGWP